MNAQNMIMKMCMCYIAVRIKGYSDRIERVHSLEENSHTEERSDTRIERIINIKGSTIDIRTVYIHRE